MTGMTKEVRKQYEAAYDKVFNSHFWGDRNNAGTSYQRGKNSAKE